MPREERLKLVVDLQPSDEEEDEMDFDRKFHLMMGELIQGNSSLVYHKNLENLETQNPKNLLQLS